MGEETLISAVKSLMKGEVSRLVEKRVEEFEKFKNLSVEEIFKELAFCLMTANFSAEKAIRIQEKIGDGFIRLEKEKLEEKLRLYGHRYPHARAEYIVEARRVMPKLREILYSGSEEKRIRRWLIKNVKGLGYKEASHFMRNVGLFDVAIIDRHILKIMLKHGLINSIPKSLTAKIYLEIEEKLENISKILGLPLGILDLYLWYLETGKILK